MNWEARRAVTYCAYRDICGFDVRVEGCEYRKMEKLDREEAVAENETGRKGAAGKWT